MARKIITTPEGYKVTLVQETYAPGLLACCNCGKSIDNNDYFAGCSDCGGIFCETCVTNGDFDTHVCKENDEDNPW